MGHHTTRSVQSGVLPILWQVAGRYGGTRMAPYDANIGRRFGRVGVVVGSGEGPHRIGLRSTGLPRKAQQIRQSVPDWNGSRHQGAAPRHLVQGLHRFLHHGQDRRVFGSHPPSESHLSVTGRHCEAIPRHHGALNYWSGAEDIHCSLFTICLFVLSVVLPSLPASATRLDSGGHAPAALQS